MAFVKDISDVTADATLDVTADVTADASLGRMTDDRPLVRRREPRVLVVAPFAPSRRAHHGAGRAMGGLVAALAACTPTALVHVRSDDADSVDDGLLQRLDVLRPVSVPAVGHRPRQLAQLLLSRPLWMQSWWSEALERTISDTITSWRPDVVQVELDVMAPALDIAARHGIASVFVVHEPAHSMDATRTRIGLVDRLDRRAWLSCERDAVARADATVVFTERDGNLLAGRPRRLRVIPLGTERAAGATDDESTREQDERPRVVFVGSGMHPPNVDAIERLVCQILPSLVERRPEVQMSIIGDRRGRLNPSCPCPVASCDHVEFLGRVDDVQPHFRQATVVVAPLRSGGGMRVKVLDAMMAGAPVVASSVALAGLEGALAAGAVCCADTDSEIVEAILGLIDDRDSRSRLGDRAACWSRDEAAWDRRVDDYLDLYDEIVAAEVPAVGVGR